VKRSNAQIYASFYVMLYHRHSFSCRLYEKIVDKYSKICGGDGRHDMRPSLRMNLCVSALLRIKNKVSVDRLSWVPIRTKFVHLQHRHICQTCFFPWHLRVRRGLSTPGDYKLNWPVLSSTGALSLSQRQQCGIHYLPN